MRIAILDDIHEAWDRAESIQRLRQRDDVEVETFVQPVTNVADLASFDVLVLNRERSRLSRETFDKLPNLKLIVQTGTIAPHIDFDAARDHSVTIAPAAGSSLGAGELTVAFLLAVMKGLFAADQGLREGQWVSALPQGLQGKTLGVVGLGRVGGYTAKAGALFEMNVLAWTPRLTDEKAAAVGAKKVSLEDLMRQSDAVAICAPLNDSSRGLITGELLDLMKPTAYLINTARGPIVDEAALIKILNERRIAGAALDVFDQEPLPPGHPITKLSNVLITPHIGWPTDVGYFKFADSAVRVIETYLDGGELPLFPRR